MIGYNKNNLDIKASYIIPRMEDVNTSKTKILASFYKILMDFDETLGIHKDVFLVLFVMSFSDGKNKYKFSDKNYKTIFDNYFIHELNRALYGQGMISRRISKPGEIPEWIIYSFESIGNGNFITVLAIMSVYFNNDIENMLPDKDKIEYLMSSTNLLKREKFISFKEIVNACKDYESNKNKLQ